MENCLLIDRLPQSALDLTADAWVDILEKHVVVGTHGIAEVLPLAPSHGAADVIGDAIVVELCLENHTDEVAAALSQWLSTMLGGEPRVRLLEALSSEVLAAATPKPKLLMRMFRYAPPLGVCGDTAALELEVELNTMDRGTGTEFWMGGLVLAEWLWHGHCAGETKIAGASVLELGAGFSGLVSRVAVAVGARRVVATDGGSDALRQLRRNVRSTPVLVRQVRWGRDSIEEACHEAIGRILFADCLYSSRALELLLQCISDCAALWPNVIVYGALCSNRARLAAVFDAGMKDLGFGSDKEALDPAILPAVLQKLPEDWTDLREEEAEIWTWRKLRPNVHLD